MKKIILFCLLGVFICSTAFADSVPPPDKSWTVEERMGRVFYFTRGRIVWGHEFGFFKDLVFLHKYSLKTFTASNGLRHNHSWRFL